MFAFSQHRRRSQRPSTVVAMRIRVVLPIMSLDHNWVSCLAAANVKLRPFVAVACFGGQRPNARCEIRQNTISELI